MTIEKALIRLSLAGVLISMLAGCDTPQAPPRTLIGENVGKVTVSPTDNIEMTLATAQKTAKANYLYRLQVLAGYYNRVGNMDKLIWTRNEIKNLENAQTFTWSGLPEVLPPEGESVADADERALAEFVVTARNAYMDAVEKLHAYYVSTGADFKANLVANMQKRFDPVRTYLYFFTAEVPPTDMQPTAVIPEADALFDEALKLHKDGKGLLHTFVTTDYEKERLALTKFLQLVQQYPTSNKLPLAAYYIGDIYKEYFNEDVRAVQWYERAWQWDPNITKPARFQAAVVYDLRLQNNAKALELYRQVVQHELFNSSNVQYANERIKVLSSAK